MIYIVSQKHIPHVVSYDFCQTSTDSENSCTARKDIKFATKTFNIPTNINYVATLPLEGKTSNLLQILTKIQNASIFSCIHLLQLISYLLLQFLVLINIL